MTKPKNPLTPERLAQLIELWSAVPYLSQPKIAKRMGVSFGTLSGLIFRNKLPPRVEKLTTETRPARKKEWQARQNERRRRERAEAAGRPFRAASEPVPAPMVVAVSPTPVAEPVAPVVGAPVPKPLAVVPARVVRAGRGCEFPVWRVKDGAYWAAIHAGRYLQCDAARALGATYCPEHIALCTGSRLAVVKVA